MKNLKIYTYLFVFLSIFLLLGCENVSKAKKFYIKIDTTDQLHDLLKNEKYPLISSHRGGSALGYPENAIATFERAQTFGPSIIEADVAMTKDSILILMHDDYLERTTTGKGLVSSHTYSELQSLKLLDYKKNKTAYTIPTLEEALLWGKGKVLFTLDVKRGVPYEKVIESIYKTQSQAYVILITYNANQARAIHKLDKNLWLSVSANSKEDILRLEDYQVDVNKVVAFVGTVEPSSTTIRYLQSRQIPIILGTLGNLDHRAKTVGDRIYEDFFKKGITILSADRNKEAAAVAQRFASQHAISSQYIFKK